MNDIASIINTLTVEERSDFVLKLKQKNKRHDTKNVELFKLLERNPNVKDVDVLLYGKRSKGAYHALSKRLFDGLVDFLATKSFKDEKSEEMEIIKLLLSSRILFEHKAYKVALKVIKKAESKAKEYELYGILNEIYYTRVQYAHLDKSVNLDNLIDDFKSNKLLFQQEENLNLFYASVQDALLKNKENINHTIVNMLSRFDISIEKGLSYRSLFKIVEINNKAANITRDFYSLLPFVEKVNNGLKEKEYLTDKHLFYHIQILYYIANSYFRNKEFNISKDYLVLMECEMQKQNNKYYQRFFPQYILLSVLNFNYSGNFNEAIKTLIEFDFNKFKKQVTYVLDLKLIKAVFLFQQNRCKEALSVFKEFTHSDNWYKSKVGEVWVVKKNLTEIMLYMELNNIDLVQSREKSFRKKHSKYLKQNNEHRVLGFLSLATHFFYNQNSINRDKFMAKVKEVLSSANSEKEDLFVLSFYAWIKAKVTKADLYESTLQVITKTN